MRQGKKNDTSGKNLPTSGPDPIDAARRSVLIKRRRAPKTPSRTRLRHRDPKPPSRLESRFLRLWESAGGPGLEKEFRFHPERRWRADFAHLPSRTLIEVEGGIWIRGRHNRAEGFMADVEKYFEAALAGWRVLRLTERELTVATVGRIIDFVARA